MKTITIKAETPIHGGLAIGRFDGRVVMIKGAIPGETVEARVDTEKKDYWTATAVRVIEPSPDRVEPRSVYFGECGGCQLQHVSYARQVRMKEEILKNTLLRIGGIEASLSPPLTGSPWNYRRRGRFKASRGKMGFFREKSREVVDVEHCSLMTDAVNAHYAKARELLRDADVRELQVSCGDDGCTALVMPYPGGMADRDDMAGALLDAGFSGVLAETKAEPLRYGKGYITLDLLGLTFTVSPTSFFQSNWELNNALVRLVIETLKPLAGRRVVDLYSGAGNFALPAAREGALVTAVEENPSAVADGRRNVEINGLAGCDFVLSGADSFEMTGPVDVLIADPPRTGLAPGALDKMLALGPGRIVYVSCDPATLSRDLKKLTAGYEIESVRLVDFFPQTYHVESLTFLRLK
ncbi:MAG TPA: class I SAM-dependent RNA methyltransferase [Nitrospirota bacterium]|nr:class I SAM-dependent RNA methyltransferase [Nitrospirota bacterium]